MTKEILNIDEEVWNADWLHSKWDMPSYKTDAFFEELKELRWTLAEFKQSAMYMRAVEDGKIVNDEWASGEQEVT